MCDNRIILVDNAHTITMQYHNYVHVRSNYNDCPRLSAKSYVCMQLRTFVFDAPSNKESAAKNSLCSRFRFLIAKFN